MKDKYNYSYVQLRDEKEFFENLATELQHSMEKDNQIKQENIEKQIRNRDFIKK